MRANRHPADRLAEVREEIHRLKNEEADLRNDLMTRPEADRIGDDFKAVVYDGTRKVLDRDKLEAELGKRAKEFFRPEPFRMVKVKRI